MELTIHTGLANEQSRINIDWFDENNVHHISHIDIVVDPRDKPRTILVSLDGALIDILPRRAHKID